MNEPIPKEIGVIVLPGTVLFPGAFMPLYIFEWRYREMLARALEEGRMFAVGTRRPGAEDEPFAVGGAGVIRACVRNPDGTSNLMLQGLRRVRFVEWTQTTPYRIAQVEPLVSCNADGGPAAELVEVVRKICAALIRDGVELPEHYEAALTQEPDTDTLTDAVTSTLVSDPELQRELLEELDVPTRARALLRALRGKLDQLGG